MSGGPTRDTSRNSIERERTCLERNCAFYALSRSVLHLASAGLPRDRLAAELLGALLELGGADAVELWLRDGDLFSRARGVASLPGERRVEAVPCDEAGAGPDGTSEALLARHLGARIPPREAGLGPRQPVPLLPGALLPATPFRSLLLVPLVREDEDFGFVVLCRHGFDAFDADDRAFYEVVAETIVVSLTNQRAHAALHERVKELTCLYSVARLAEQPDLPLGELLQSIALLLPPAWQYPEIARARILLDGGAYETPGFLPGVDRQRAEILVGGQLRGAVEVHYGERRPALDEGPFLKEERNLIDALAREIAGIIARRQAQEEKARLEQQLLHADRLATIGQLAAGVGHELNEPLGAILGFAQLALDERDLPRQVGADLGKIVQACLHAREVVRKLRLFARQMPPNKARLDLNDVVRDNLYFFNARCAKEGIELRQELADGLPPIVADASQLNQVLLNLVVNALQAMPDGGRLTIRTLAEDGAVLLVVEDTGTGMSEEVRAKIFLPFFTTKEVDQGTGLGLSVVHGIVSSHGGTITAESEAGQGSRFSVRLPTDRHPEKELV